MSSSPFTLKFNTIPRRSYSTLKMGAGGSVIVNEGLENNLVNAKDNTNSVLRLNPWFVTGFTDAEGSFMILIRKRSQAKNSSVPYSVEAVFQIKLHMRDKELVDSLQSYFGAGRIEIDNKLRAYGIIISSLDQLINNVIPHFDSYPLKTQKLADYLL
jgi:hypothetical protein